MRKISKRKLSFGMQTIRRLDCVVGGAPQSTLRGCPPDPPPRLRTGRCGTTFVFCTTTEPQSLDC